MALAEGTRLGAYEVVGLLGAGGMGEVYRARDTQLRRDVALKILPPLFAADPDRRTRFMREAHLLASLNHPHMATSTSEAAGARAQVGGVHGRYARGLCNAVKRLLDRLRERDADEVGARVQIVFPRFVDHAKQVVSDGEVVFDDGVELSQLEGGGIIVVAHTHGELPSRRSAPLCDVVAVLAGSVRLMSHCRLAS